MDIAIPGIWVIVSVVALVLFVIGLILFMRNQLNKKSNEALVEKYQGDQTGSPLVGRSKYPELDVFRLSGPIYRFGLALALGVMILAFNWTTFEDAVFIPDDALEFDEEIEIEPPRTAEPPPPPPPPPPPVIEEVPDEEIIEEEQPEFEDMTIEEETVVEAPPPPKKAPPPPPPPPPPPVEDEIFKVVQQMPRFPGCENEAGDDKAKQQCAQKKMLEFIYKNIKYPAIARENGVEGTTVITFVVEKDGSVTDAKVVRDIGAQCGQEALRVVNLMNKQGLKWTPGKQRGKPVRVQFNLPVKFRLE